MGTSFLNGSPECLILHHKRDTYWGILVPPNVGWPLGPSDLIKMQVLFEILLIL